MLVLFIRLLSPLRNGTGQRCVNSSSRHREMAMNPYAYGYGWIHPANQIVKERFTASWKTNLPRCRNASLQWYYTTCEGIHQGVWVTFLSSGTGLFQLFQRWNTGCGTTGTRNGAVLEVYVVVFIININLFIYIVSANVPMFQCSSDFWTNSLLQIFCAWLILHPPQRTNDLCPPLSYIFLLEHWNIGTRPC